VEQAGARGAAGGQEVKGEILGHDLMPLWRAGAQHRCGNPILSSRKTDRWSFCTFAETPLCCIKGLDCHEAARLAMTVDATIT
jgi:hypothetical protein